MAIINRAKDVSEQKDVFQARFQTVVNGQTLLLGIAPYPCTIDSIRAVCNGISGAPSAAFYKTAAAGITLEILGTSGVIASVGTSGVISSASFLAAAGSTVLNIASNGQLLMLTAGGTGAAAVEVLVEYVLKKTQDIVAHNGNSS